MPDELWLVRHGPTEWSRDGRHTSVTDLPLLPEGEDDARALGPRLADLDPVLVLTSPRLRARRTAELAGFTGADAEVDDDLAEWAYGDYEGVTTAEIRDAGARTGRSGRTRAPAGRPPSRSPTGSTGWSPACARRRRAGARLRPRPLAAGARRAVARPAGQPTGRSFASTPPRSRCSGDDAARPVVLRWNA